MNTNFKICTCCKLSKNIENFPKTKTTPSSKIYYKNLCKKCNYINKKDYFINYRKKYSEKYREQSRRWKETNRERHLLMRTKNRAKLKELDFNLELSDIIIPEFCPILGIKLEFNKGKVKDNSPSIDRTDSEKGYIKGNVIIISYRANVIKNCGTSTEHEKIAKWMRGYGA